MFIIIAELWPLLHVSRLPLYIKVAQGMKMLSVFSKHLSVILPRVLQQPDTIVLQKIAPFFADNGAI